MSEFSAYLPFTEQQTGRQTMQQYANFRQTRLLESNKLSGRQLFDKKTAKICERLWNC